jgi:hypothetical protein
VKLAQLALPNSRAMRLVTICSELAGKNEFMTSRSRCRNNGSDGDVRESGIARAKDFARHFADLPVALFPMGGTARRLG